MSSNQPIGILDSGFGGLSVARAVRAALPHETLVFAADCAYAPYGNRPSEYILERLKKIVTFLLHHNVKSLVFACNTATAVGIKYFREALSMPIIGIEPAVFPAVRHTRSGAVGVLATSRTIESAKYANVKMRALEWAEVSRPMPVTIHDVPCPGLMECVERGDFNSPVLHQLLSTYVDPLTKAGVDEVVLGCTHYPFLAEAVAQHAPDAVLIDPAPAVAQQLERRLGALGLLADRTGLGEDQFFASGANAAREAVLRTLWADPEARLQELSEA